MRGLQLGTVVGRRLFGTSNAACLHHVGSFAGRTTISATFVRQYSSAKDDDKTPPPWTPHTLSPSSESSMPVIETISSLTATKNEPRTHRAYIALGSNLGDRIGWIEKACDEMTKRGIKVKRTSSLWETSPMYVLNQEEFVNGTCEVETTLEPLALLDELQSIENDLGREKIIDKGPRNIDLDILLYDDHVINHERLNIPHPGMFEREFVLRPLAELIPAEPLHPSAPWKVTQDYLNALPPTTIPISTMTPLSDNHVPLRALDAKRQTLVMAILNVTPDSFSDGGKNYERPPRSHLTKNARKRLEREAASEAAKTLDGCWPDADTKPTSEDPLNAAGVSRAYSKYQPLFKSAVSIIDIGGQSTAPKAKPVTSDEEIARVIPAIMLAAADRIESGTNKVISIDTYRAAVAEAAVEAGADIINDVGAGTLDPDMLPLMARLGKTVILNHMRGTPETMSLLTDYPSGIIHGVATELLARVAAAEAAGIRRWRIILDPGLGFAKTPEQNVELIRRFHELRDWPGLRGMPWLVGGSRKRFVGSVTGVNKPDKRDWGTAATVAAAVWGGADVVRVHEFKGMPDVVRMSDAIWRV